MGCLPHRKQAGQRVMRMTRNSINVDRGGTTGLATAINARPPRQKKFRRRRRTTTITRRVRSRSMRLS